MKLLTLLLVVIALGACSSPTRRAPVVDSGSEMGKNVLVEASPARKAIARESDWRPQTHKVQKGDTLYSIALNYGFDYRELAQLNNLPDPNVIQIGQELRLFSSPSIVPPAAVEVQEIAEVKDAVKSQPLLAKYKYSETAVAEIEKVQGGEPAVMVAAAPKPEKKPEPKPQLKPQPKPQPVVVVTASKPGEDELEWQMPVKGDIIGNYSEAANRKGIDIGGERGQLITASAPGKVVYSGSGLRGYGKLVIIKHNNTYLSAYAHNDQLLVKEGQSITRGQKIAEMGKSDTDQVKLHFEVRRFGKPVDPAKYLPLGKS